MRLSTRKLLDHTFSAVGGASLLFMCAALVVLLIPMFAGGAGAVFFRETIERRLFVLEHFDRGNAEAIRAEARAAEEARKPVYDMFEAYERSRWEALENLARQHKAPDHVIQMIEEQKVGFLKATEKYEMAMAWARRDPGKGLETLKEEVELLEPLREAVRELLGPFPGEAVPPRPVAHYGATRMRLVREHLQELLYRTEYGQEGTESMGRKVLIPRRERFADTELEGLFAYFQQHLDDMLRPRFTFYWRFWFDESVSAYAFGGIWPEVLGTLYLAFGTMIIAAPVGVICAVYLAEYAGDGPLVSLIRICISTLAGVPSVVFGLFGLAFFINTVGLPKSLFVGCLTLAALVLPTVIRASEEALKAVPQTYKEAALSLGASRWRSVAGVILPAALPGIITSIIISMGRAAGETAPILFTAAVALGPPLKPWEIFSNPAPALPYNIYSIVAEHEAVDQVIHVPYGMVMTLIVLVLLLNLAAIILRARISRKLRG